MIVASIREVKARIATKTIKAPFDGIVGIKLVHEGQYLNAGERVASLVDASHLKLNFSLMSKWRHSFQLINLLILQLMLILIKHLPAHLMP